MSKGVDSKKAEKKAPAKTPKEKKADKKIKKLKKSNNQRCSVWGRLRIAQTGQLDGGSCMDVDIDKLITLKHKRADEIENSVAGTGYLPRTVIGVCTFLIDNEGDLDLLSAKQKLTFERFILPLLDAPRR